MTTRTQTQQASRNRQIIAFDVLPTSTPKPKPTETRTVGQWRLEINNQLCAEDSAIFVAQLDNQPPDVQIKIMDAWQAHLNACAIYERMHHQGPVGVTGSDLKVQRITVVETGVAALNWGRESVDWRPELGDCPHKMPEHLCIECRDVKRKSENQ